jgi:hypothetical protein
MFHMFPLTAPLTAQLYTKGETCQPMVLGSSRAYALGPEEPPTSFQRVDLTTDP